MSLLCLSFTFVQERTADLNRCKPSELAASNAPARHVLDAVGGWFYTFTAILPTARKSRNVGLPQKAVPVGDHDLATPQVFHAVRRNELTGSIKA
jgi:hypothetical protein